MFMCSSRVLSPSRGPIFFVCRETIVRQNNVYACKSTSRYHKHNFATHFRAASTMNGDAKRLCLIFHEIGHRSDLVDRFSRSKPPDDVLTQENDRPSLTDTTNLFTKTSTANLTSDLCKTYLSLPHISLSTWTNNACTEKRLFLELLLTNHFRADDKVLASTMTNILSRERVQISDKSIRRIREMCTPKYERMFHYILGSAHEDLGVAFLVQLRKDVREVIHWLRFSEEKTEGLLQHESRHLDLTKLRDVERDIQTILTSLFRPGVLNLQKITYEKTPASIIEQIAFKEAVHPLQSLNDLRTRLGPGRRCYAFFHPALQDSPLVFVHVALMQTMPQSMHDLQDGTQRIVDGIEVESEATCATFYSITNANSGLVGVDLGNHLIKSVVRVLKNEIPSLQTFCTLSPIPNFLRWLEGRTSTSDKFMNMDLFTDGDMRTIERLFPSDDTSSSLNALIAFLKDPQWHLVSQDTTSNIKPLLLKLAAYYLSVEKHLGRVLCPVAKFHIRNGAEMFRLNYLSDTTSKGLRSSCGIMINYRYSLEELEENRVNYERTGIIVVREGVNHWLAN